MTVQLSNPQNHIVVPFAHHVSVATGTRHVHIAGQVSWDENGELVAAGDLAGQVAQVYRNIAKSLESVGAGFSDVVRFTWYVAGWKPEMFDAYNAGVAQAAKEFDITTPPASLIGVDTLFQPEILVEAEAYAVLP